MNKEKLLELLNNGIMDTHFLYEQYVENGGMLYYVIFIQVLPQYAKMNGGIESLYKGLMIKHSVCKLMDKGGVFLKYC